MQRRGKCCRCKRNCTPGYFFIAIGVGLFLAYSIPRYLLITLLGLGFIGMGVCMIVRK